MKQDDQVQSHGKLECHDHDQNSIKQNLIISYKKNLYPVLKTEIHKNYEEKHFPTSNRSTSSRGN